MENKKYLKLIIIASSGILIILIGLLLWNLVFSKYKIFNDQEELFLNTVKRFYSLNSQYLPKSGETREMTLQYLYDGEHIEDLYVPKTSKLCDSNSWVRVYKDNDGKYHYNTYLKCGKYESKVDHDGPVITLNGNMQYVISLNSSYTELGVKSIVDDTDGNISNDKVVIDSSKINTSKIGVYPVTYTVYDKTYNKTVVTRNVVVANNLTEVVRNNTDESNYYKGSNINNYLLFSGMLFRIVNVNLDGSVKIITDGAITNLRANYDTYKDSNVDTWLNKVFYKALNNSDNYLVSSDYCMGKINSMNDYSTYCSDSINSKVGLLNVNDYMNTLVGTESSIYSTSFMLANKIGNNYAEGFYSSDTVNGVSNGILAPIRPVITLKSNLYLVSGDGSRENPYKLDDYSYAKSNDKINTRLVGEYLEYSGLTFRIIGIDSDKNVRVIMASPWVVQPNNKKLFVSVSDVENLKFNLKNADNPGYILNNTYTDYLNMDSIIETKYEIPVNDNSKNYNKYKTSSIKAKILLPTTYELFAASGNDTMNRASSYLYIDNSLNNDLVFMVNGVNGKVFELNKKEIDSYAIRTVLTLKGDLKISSGNGTVNKPYLLK